MLLKSCHCLGYFSDLADLINAALEELVRAQLELSTASLQAAARVQPASCPVSGILRSDPYEAYNPFRHRQQGRMHNPLRLLEVFSKLDGLPRFLAPFVTGTSIAAGDSAPTLSVTVWKSIYNMITGRRAPNARARRQDPSPWHPVGVACVAATGTHLP